MSFAIVTDTSANLPNRLLRQRDIRALPLSFSVDGEPRTVPEAEDFDAAGFFAAMRAGAKVVTSQIPPQAYLDCFGPLLAAGRDVLFVSITSGISGTYQSALMASRVRSAPLKE